MIDLHTHSTASDGALSPSDLVDFAAKKGISVLAITDHDTVSGLAEGQEAAKKAGLVFVPGIEVSIQWPTGEFHLLGLGLKKCSKELRAIINFLREERINRNKKMALKLQEAGVNISYEEVSEKFNTENVGRPHFAKVMVEKGMIKNPQQAFDRYFAKGRPCYVDRVGADLNEAVMAIESSGGIPVQAHPLSMYVSWGRLEGVLRDIADSGVKGFEAWHPGVRISEAERLEKIAHSMGLIVTAGSDFHGEKVRADRKIGQTAGKSKINDRFWQEELEVALKRIHNGDDHSFFSVE